MPHYPIDTETHRIIIALKDECHVLGIDNISFSYSFGAIVFSVDKYRNHWELVVRSGKTADIYRIKGTELEFKRSEVD